MQTFHSDRSRLIGRTIAVLSLFLAVVYVPGAQAQSGVSGLQVKKIERAMKTLSAQEGERGKLGLCRLTYVDSSPYILDTDEKMQIAFKALQRFRPDWFMVAYDEFDFVYHEKYFLYVPAGVCIDREGTVRIEQAQKTGHACFLTTMKKRPGPYPGSYQRGAYYLQQVDKSVHWTGNVVDGLIDGKGCGWILNDGLHLIEGEFDRGVPVSVTLFTFWKEYKLKKETSFGTVPFSGGKNLVVTVNDRPVSILDKDLSFIKEFPSALGDASVSLKDILPNGYLCQRTFKIGGVISFVMDDNGKVISFPTESLNLLERNLDLRLNDLLAHYTPQLLGQGKPKTLGFDEEMMSFYYKALTEGTIDNPSGAKRISLINDLASIELLLTSSYVDKFIKSARRKMHFGATETSAGSAARSVNEQYYLHRDVYYCPIDRIRQAASAYPQLRDKAANQIVQKVYDGYMSQVNAIYKEEFPIAQARDSEHENWEKSFSERIQRAEIDWERSYGPTTEIGSASGRSYTQDGRIYFTEGGMYTEYRYEDGKWVITGGPGFGMKFNSSAELHQAALKAYKQAFK